ncbi:MAG: 2-dehydropantoate 2-reductase [Verrucomicrobia bacterium]|nr:2-dehydropantoate 2-reductase [Verrucomicrobiota bacterium]
MFSKVAIVGSGALGMLYGAQLALAGRNVRFLMRSDLAQVREHGIRLVANGAVRTLMPVAAFGSTGEIGPVDLVFVLLKTTANHELARLLPPLLHARTVVVTLQNGLGNEEWIASLVGRERVVGGLCYIAANRTAPGEVTCNYPGTMTIAEVDGPSSPRTRAIAEMFRGAGVNCAAEDNLPSARWHKLVWNVAFNGLTVAAGGVTTDQIVSSPALTARARALMDEVAAAAGALGYPISGSFVKEQIDRTPGLGPYRPSTLVDFLAGREIELEAIWGEPLRRGQAAGVAMPELARLYAELKSAAAIQ